MKPNLKKRTAVLISGNGSNLQALIDAAATPDYPAEIALVLSNKAEAFGLERARKADIQTEILSHRDFPSREAFDDRLDTVLREHHIEFVCLAGFMRLLTPGFVMGWEGKMLNIHPSLLPSFKGLDTHARVLEGGVRFTGCTVHFVVPEMDAGPIIIQACVPVAPDDTADTLAARVHQAEHSIYPKALEWLASGQLKIVENGVKLKDAKAPETTLINPR